MEPPSDSLKKTSEHVSRKTAFTESALKERRSLRLSMVEDLLLHFSPAERAALYVVGIIFVISSLALLVQANAAVSVVVPAPGGMLLEGEVGAPRFINPLLAVSQTDRDMTALMYSGLMRQLPSGLIPDLAESYEVSADGTTYTFHLRKNAKFHDGKSVTAEDVAYTIQMAQNPAIKSPQRANWDGVSVSTPDQSTVVFTLPHPYAPFLSNTTLGILPKNLWKNVPESEFPYSTLNTDPIGSGPYKMGTMEEDRNGTPTRYSLNAFSKFAIAKPYLSTIVFLFYPNQDALAQAVKQGDVQSFAALTPISLQTREGGSTILKEPLERVFAVFFNQGHNSVLADLTVRKALDAVVDKQTIIQHVLSGYGEALQGPYPEDTGRAATTSADQRITNAKQILQNGGWKFDTASGTWKKGGKTLSLTLSTSDADQLVATAQAVAADWKALGVSVNVQVYSLSELNENIIRPRDYDAILFGEVVGPTLDLFAFWHSSQRLDPGLNLSLYANTKADKLLSQARATIEESARAKLNRDFSSLIATDEPAVFLYTPDLVYVVPQSLKGIQIGSLTSASDRFANVYEWHIQTERVWDVFAQ